MLQRKMVWTTVIVLLVAVSVGLASEAATSPAGVPASAPAAHHEPPGLAAVLPFALLLLAIAILPLIPGAAHWWHHNRNKLIVSGVLGGATLAYYLLRGRGFHAEAGWASVGKVLEHALLAEYIPFIVLLFSLYTISGGIRLQGDLKATPAVNTFFLAAGSVMASFVGTTGASMLLIRPLLQTNRERTHVRHTVIFFIFLVSNIGGSLLPIGDPPLFLGYLKGVPFLWTVSLWKEWLFCCGLLLVIYFVWDTIAYRREPARERFLDAVQIEPLTLRGQPNFFWLVGVVLAVATIVPGEQFLGRGPVVPEFLREIVMLVIVALAWVTSSRDVRKANEFNFEAITEVAVLFVGIFIAMQAPVELLNIKGPDLPLKDPTRFFWATGILSSFLDNAPTYNIFFETANSLTHEAGPGILKLLSGHYIREDLLTAISIGAVFMGANTYIGNGPNFMVKSIAESSGVRMPSFFGYMAYSCLILLPLFGLVTLVFMM